MNFGSVNDTDDSLKSKTGGVFGLNSGAFFTNIAFNPTAGKDGAAANAVDIEIKVGDRQYNRRLYEVTDKLYGSKGDLLEAPAPGQEASPEYAEAYKTEMTQRMAVVIHAIKAAGVTQEQIDKALATPVPTFAAWAEIVTALVPANYTTTPIDIFLQYQWDIKDGNDKTYLELPKNMKGGRFLSSHVAPKGGAWEAVIDEAGMRYVDGEKNEHPFVKSDTFMQSPKAYQQIEGEETGPVNPTGNANFSENSAAASKKSTW